MNPIQIHGYTAFFHFAIVGKHHLVICIDTLDVTILHTRDTASCPLTLKFLQVVEFSHVATDVNVLRFGPAVQTLAGEFRAESSQVIVFLLPNIAP